MILFNALFLNKFASWMYLLTICVVLWPVIAIILLSSAPSSAAESGAEERSIMAMTGHKSTEMVRRYIKDANIFKDNALNKIKL